LRCAAILARRPPEARAVPKLVSYARATLPVIVLVSLADGMRRKVEAFAQKSQQLVSRAKAQLPPGVDLFDSSFEMTRRRPRLGSQLENERPSHYSHTTPARSCAV
jgi:hypothetical protein